jgi:hypothetical protein
LATVCVWCVACGGVCDGEMGRLRRRMRAVACWVVVGY